MMTPGRSVISRLHIVLVGIFCFAALIIGRVGYIQWVEGSYLRRYDDSMHQQFQEVDARRGNIYSADGKLLTTSLIFSNVYIDFQADGLAANHWKRLKDNMDSLSTCLATHFKDRSATAYKAIFQQGMVHRKRYYPFLKKISLADYEALQRMPLIRQGKNKSGFIFDAMDRRVNLFPGLATRTIGIGTEYISSEGKMSKTHVGIERGYDSVLLGTHGKRLVRNYGGNRYELVDDNEIEAEPGSDLVTTLDVYAQYVTEKALLKVLTSQQATYGCAIVMDSKTSMIRAIANLGRMSDGSYGEIYNYAIQPSEPGSVFSLVTLIALLEDKYVTLNKRVFVQRGQWSIDGRKFYDTESRAEGDISVKEAFEQGSNVAMAYWATQFYGTHPDYFINEIKRLKLDVRSDVDIPGESLPVINTPGSSNWSSSSLSWMAIGQQVEISPLQTLQLYNAVGNDAIMMKPRIVSEIRKGNAFQSTRSGIRVHGICTTDTIMYALQKCLEGVCERGTASAVFKGLPFKVAGKTATTRIAEDNRGYARNIYQSTFVGYFPANDPRYSCIVLIRNKPNAPLYYGAAVAAPVFREIAEALYKTQLAPP